MPRLETYFGVPQPGSHVNLPQDSGTDTSGRDDQPVMNDNALNATEQSYSSVTETNLEETRSPNSTITSEQLEFTDPAQWPLPLTENQRKYLVERGPCRLNNQNYPTDSTGRRFVETNYKRHLVNGETVNRVWLVYSSLINCVFCFCCKLFRPNEKIALVTGGFHDWKNIGKCLHEHEVSKKHLECMQNWRSLETSLCTHTTIDETNERIIRSERERWRSVFERLFAIVQYLAKQNLAFRGSADRIYQPHNGNFLGLVELIAKFDPVMREHLRRIQSDEIHDHYLGKTIQNELISTMASKVQEVITMWTKQAKYYTIILDCTPDVSHQEQFSLTIRFVKLDESPDVPVSIEEHFIAFLPVEETSGKGLSNVLLQELEKLQLSTKDIHGQGYDNGANMKGHKSGLQARILESNPRAFFAPCACHNLNLLLSDMAKSSVKGTKFFGVLARLYTFLSGSTKRWTILKKHISSLTVKPLCETRWESRVDSVGVLRYQANEVHDALIEISESLNDPQACSEAESLADAILDYSFIVSVVFWYEILFRVNKISKTLQQEDVDLSVAIEMLDSAVKWLKEYRQKGLPSAMVDAREIAEELGIVPKFKATRTRRKKAHFGEAQDETITDPQELFRVDYFNVILDRAIASMDERFQQLKTHYDKFSVLCNFFKLPQSKVVDQCKQLEISLCDKDDKDINGIMLADELGAIRSLIPSVTEKSPSELLQYLHKNKLCDVFPNTSIGLRIWLTIPVTVASGERSFSKLKLIKTYLRSTMLQDRLTNLAILSIEHEVVTTLDCSELIDTFANVKARKIDL